MADLYTDVNPKRTRCPSCGYDFLNTYDVNTLPKMCYCPKCHEFTPRTDLSSPEDLDITNP